MKKHEIIGLLIILIISTIYSFTLPDRQVEQIESKPKIKIIVEGKVAQTLIFKTSPTVGDVLKKLDLENIYGFDQKTVLTTESIFYIPEGNDLISLNNATKEQLMTIKGIGPKTADKIIAYRQEQRFCTIEDIKKISGIGEKTYLRIRSLLCL